MIHLSLTSQKIFLLLQAENPCRMVFRNGLPAATTPDHENHSFCVKSIRVSDGRFVLKVLQPIPGDAVTKASCAYRF